MLYYPGKLAFCILDLMLSTLTIYSSVIKWAFGIQVDFNLPERFKLLYVDSITERKQPIMIHRAIFGSLERFFGILIENYAGDFPLWLAPVQARVLPVTDTEVLHCERLLS